MMTFKGRLAPCRCLFVISAATCLGRRVGSKFLRILFLGCPDPVFPTASIFEQHLHLAAHAD